MTIGEIAGLVAALAFAVLVIFISLNLSKLSKVMNEVRETVRRLNSTIDIVTKDVDNLSIEVEGLLNKANTLVDDVNGKLSKTDPLFTAIGDIGVTVSDLNESTKQMASNLIDGTSKKKKSPVERFVNSSLKMAKVKDKIKPKSSLHIDAQQQPAPNTRPVDLDSELVSLTKQKSSSTAGEINLK